jgi:hypothetical protein
MVTETTLRDFLIYYCKNQYSKRAKLIFNLSCHIDAIHKKYIINNTERTTVLSNLDNIIVSLSSMYNKIIQPYNNKDDKYYDISLFEFLKIENDLDDDVVNIMLSLTELPTQFLPKGLKNIFPTSTELKKIDKDICNVVIKNGSNKIENIIDVFCDYKNIKNCLTHKTYELINDISLVFVPIGVEVINSEFCNDGNIIKINDDEKYEILLDNYHKIQIDILEFDEIKISLEIFGYFINDFTY